MRFTIRSGMCDRLLVHIVLFSLGVLGSVSLGATADAALASTGPAATPAQGMLEHLVWVPLVHAPAPRINVPAWTTTTVDLRVAPGTQHAVLRTLPAGAPVWVETGPYARVWYQVVYEGTWGYVPGDRLARAPRYVFPVQGSTSVTYGPCHHDYPASDIFTPTGSRFVAVVAGVVDHVSYTDTWDPAVDAGSTRGGLSVAIIGDDGVRYYGSHLSSIGPNIAEGVRVRAGQLLGLTGATGSARGTPPHLHFGISPPTTPDDWAVRRGTIDPYPHLNAWQAGRLSTPDLTKTGGGVC